MKTICCALLAFTFMLGACKKKQEMMNNRVSPHDYLSGEKYTELYLEINYVQGFAPQADAINHLKTFLENRLHKPNGIRIVQREIPAPEMGNYDVNDLIEIEKQTRTEQTKKEKLTVSILLLDKHYETSSTADHQVLGIQYGPSSIALFSNTIRDYTGGFGQPSRTTLEATVLEHEFGHLLGLTNNGTAMISQHEDQEFHHHCNNSDCLMYASVETSNFVGNLISNKIPTLDDACLNDLRANGGK